MNKDNNNKDKCEQDEKWYFTFGCGQVHENCFIVFYGTFHDARRKMFKAFGDKWSFQYSSKNWNNYKSPFNGEISSQEKVYNLKEIFI